MFTRIFTALGAAVLLMYLILVVQFGSFLDPLAILLSLPLSLMGVVLALLITGDTLNIMSLIGVILLMGIVAKNAILLIDFAKWYHEKGMPLRDALIEAGRVRLRPIMMTTIALIAGMIPVALGRGEGADFRAPLGRAVIGGVITSTLLTLLVIPTVYEIVRQLPRLDDGKGLAPVHPAPAGAPGPQLSRAGLLQEVLHRRHDPNDLLQLAALVHPRRLVPRQNHEHTLVGLADGARPRCVELVANCWAASRALAVASASMDGLSWLSRVKMKVGPPTPYSPLEERITPPATSSLTFWLAAMTTSGVRERTMTVCWMTKRGPLRSPGKRLAKASETSERLELNGGRYRCRGG